MERMLKFLAMPGLTRKLKVIDATTAVVCALAAPAFFYFAHPNWGWLTLAMGGFSALTCYFEPFKHGMQFLKGRLIRK
jgi:hypothetical protein